MRVAIIGSGVGEQLRSLGVRPEAVDFVRWRDGSLLLNGCTHPLSLIKYTTELTGRLTGRRLREGSLSSG